VAPHIAVTLSMALARPRGYQVVYSMRYARARAAEDAVEMPDTAASAEALETPPAYDANRYYLGKLCPRSHDWHGTGPSLRYTRNRLCLQCDREKTAARRQAQRPTGEL
jgi:hypothetical protein